VVVVAATLARARQLERLLAAPGFAVVGVARGAEESERLVAQATPAAVLIDLDLTSGGLEAIERIMATRATPIVVVGDAAGQPEAALAAGAVDVTTRNGAIVVSTIKIRKTGSFDASALFALFESSYSPPHSSS
jgi:CheY-like chemotaxis protein